MAIKLTKKDAANLDCLLGAYNVAREELIEFLEECATDWESEFDDKSEHWQQSEAARKALSRIDAVRGLIDELGEDAWIDTESLT